MLKFLNIKNFAVIQRAEIDFQVGLTLLTGETGSGKSIIIDALGVLLGGRSLSTQIRTGEGKATIEGGFTLTGQSLVAAKSLLGATINGEAESYELVIRRELYANNRNRIFINSQSASISTLRALQRLLVETHGQGEQRALLSAHSQLDLLDQFAGCSTLKRQVSEAYARWRVAKEALKRFESDVAEREKGKDFHQFQLSELEKLAPKPHEDEDLEAQRRILTHAEMVFELVSGAHFELYESEESILSRLSVVRKKFGELDKIDQHFETATAVLENCIAALADIAETLRQYGAKLEFSPSKLAEIENRLADLGRFKRRYNTDIRGILKILEELSERLLDSSDSAVIEAGLNSELKAADSNYKALASQLSSCRRSAKGRLEKLVMKDLKHVAMENAQFIVFQTSTSFDASDNAPGGFLSGLPVEDDHPIYRPNGVDQVEFLLTANQGESPRPLAHVASGGELSRLMLTLRTIGRRNQEREPGMATLIFDEIDAGIGGSVAEAVGQRLKSLAETQQVLCVTHQPQIACFADHHYLIEKVVENGRTMTLVKELAAEERIGELARMIGGNERAATARETARWLLSGRDKRKRGNTRAKK